MMTGRDRNQAPTPLSPAAVLQTVALLSERHAKEAWTLAPNSSSEIFLSPLFSWQPSFLHCSLPFTLNEEEWPHPRGRGLGFFPLLLHSKLQFPRVFFSLLCGGYLSSRATQSNYRSIKGFRDQSFCQQFSHGRLRGFYRVRVNEISFHVEISRGKALKKRIYGKGSPVFLLVCQSLHTW